VNNPGIGYDTYIAGAIFLAFVIFVTAKGELPAYLQLFLYSPPASAAATTPAAQSSGATSGNVPSSLFNWAAGALGLVPGTASPAAAAARQRPRRRHDGGKRR
jgi:hypothetical protein